MAIGKTLVVGLVRDFCAFKLNIQPNSQLACRMSQQSEANDSLLQIAAMPELIIQAECFVCVVESLAGVGTC